MLVWVNERIFLLYHPCLWFDAPTYKYIVRIVYYLSNNMAPQQFRSRHLMRARRNLCIIQTHLWAGSGNKRKLKPVLSAALVGMRAHVVPCHKRNVKTTSMHGHESFCYVAHYLNRLVSSLQSLTYFTLSFGAYTNAIRGMKNVI